MSRFESLKKLLSKIDTPEKAAALKGKERQQYLDALDEVYGPRDQRIADMGFSPETYYHGTGSNFDEFSLSKLKRDANSHFESKPIYFSESPTIASEYAEDAASNLDTDELVRNLEKNFKNIPDSPEKQQMWFDSVNSIYDNAGQGIGENVIPVYLRGTPISYKNAEKIRKETGQNVPEYYDMVKDNSMSQVAVKNPNQIRSVNAAFDPRFKDSANLLALNKSNPNILDSIINSGTSAAMAGLDILDRPARALRAGIGAAQEGGDILGAAKSQFQKNAPEAPSGSDLADKFSEQTQIENPLLLTALATAAEMADPSSYIPGVGPFSKIAKIVKKGKKAPEAIKGMKKMERALSKVGDISFPAANEAVARKVEKGLKMQGRVPESAVLQLGEKAPVEMREALIGQGAKSIRVPQASLRETLEDFPIVREKRNIAMPDVAVPKSVSESLDNIDLEDAVKQFPGLRQKLGF